MHQVDISKIKGKSVLMTGGLGFLGINLSRKLLGLGANVTLFVSPGKNREKVRDIESKLKIFEGRRSKYSNIKQNQGTANIQVSELNLPNFLLKR